MLNIIIYSSKKSLLKINYYILGQFLDIDYIKENDGLIIHIKIYLEGKLHLIIHNKIYLEGKLHLIIHIKIHMEGKYAPSPLAFATI